MVFYGQIRLKNHAVAKVYRGIMQESFVIGGYSVMASD
jgi:hypothetical protein